MKCTYICLLIILATSLTGCYDRDILEFKPGESLDPITNLTYNVNTTEVDFNWDLPASYPDDIDYPVSVFMTVYQDDMKISTTTIPDAPTTYTYSEYDSGSAYRFIFKVQGDVNTIDLNESNLRYSEGSIVEL